MEAKYLVALLMVITQISLISSECPKPELLNPCTCKDDLILCSGAEEINLKKIFESLSKQLPEDKKHFKEFRLENTAIKEIEENTFYDLIFDEIMIDNAKQLTNINTNAFNKTNPFMKMFYVLNTPLVNNPPTHDIFSVISQMNALEKLYLKGVNIEEIPSYAFKPINGYQNKLTMVDIYGNNLKIVDNFAFYNLISLTNIFLAYNSIHSIPADAFKFAKESTELLTIELDGMLFNGTNINANALQNIGRPVVLKYFCDNQNALSKCDISYLDANIFEKFLASNPMNAIKSHYDKKSTLYHPLKINCDDCGSRWIITANAVEKIEAITCTNGKTLKDSTNFAKCA